MEFPSIQRCMLRGVLDMNVACTRADFVIRGVCFEWVNVSIINYVAKMCRVIYCILLSLALV